MSVFFLFVGMQSNFNMSAVLRSGDAVRSRAMNRSIVVNDWQFLYIVVTK